MAGSYMLGSKQPAKPFPMKRFLGVLTIVLGVAGMVGWYAFRQPQTADIHNAPAVTRTVPEQPRKR